MMFNWFKKKSAPENKIAPATLPVHALPTPTPLAATAAVVPRTPKAPHDITISYANANRTWSEQFNLIDVLAAVLQKHGHRPAVFPDRIEDPEHGFTLRPKMEGFKPTDQGGAQTTTTMHITHRSLFSTRVFEYQHSVGQSAQDSITKGFDHWVQVDYAVFIEALRDKPIALTMLAMTFPTQAGIPERHRRVLLGPIAHFQQKPVATQTAADSHSFCPCCLLTRSFETFKLLVDSDGFFAVRMFAARDKTGAVSADCRVNGEEFEQGKEALRKYVQTWPGEGIEFRKQYIIIQTMPSAASGETITRGKLAK